MRLNCLSGTYNCASAVSWEMTSGIFPESRLVFSCLVLVSCNWPGTAHRSAAQHSGGAHKYVKLVSCASDAGIVPPSLLDCSCLRGGRDSELTMNWGMKSGPNAQIDERRK